MDRRARLARPARQGRRGLLAHPARLAPLAQLVRRVSEARLDRPGLRAILASPGPRVLKVNRDLLDDGIEGGVSAAAKACGVSRSTLARWQKRRAGDEAMHRAFLETKSDIRARERERRVDRVIDHLAQGGGMFDLAEELGVSRSTLYLDLKELGGIERIYELREHLAAAADLQALTLRRLAQAALIEDVPYLQDLLRKADESPTVRAAALAALQKMRERESTGTRAAVSVTNNVVAAAQAGAAVGEAEPPVVDIEALADDDLHELADKLLMLEAG